MRQLLEELDDHKLYKQRQKIRFKVFVKQKREFKQTLQSGLKMQYLLRLQNSECRERVNSI